ncbi:MAG: hypothetical protein KC621_15020 [Myxococcales bacterium]|nr:hypothetical protein [Myxococcales bacterium]
MSPSYEAAIEVPALDLAPDHPVAATMDQSLAVVWDIDRLGSLGLREGSGALLHPEPLAIGIGLGLDYAFAMFLAPIPLALTHEEWHLAALREGGVTGTNLFLQGEVTDVSDEELVAIKANDPEDLVRAHAAGIESHNTLVRRIGDEAFLHGPEGARLGPLDLMGTWMAPHAQYAELNSWNYFRYCGSGQTDEVVPVVEDLEGTTVPRDFTGPDCTGWVRDLRRPDEPYADRGAHASGEGIGRYVQSSDLTPDEQRLLKLQTALHFVDLANPHLLGIDRVHVGEVALTASLMHWLTPWGYALDLHGGWRRGSGAAVLGALRLGIAERPTFPAVEVRVVDVPIGAALSLQTRTELWLQPRDLRYDGSPVPGGRLGARLGWRVVDRLSGYVGVDAKSAGWTPGVPALGPAVYGQLGATALLGRPSTTW